MNIDKSSAVSLFGGLIEVWIDADSIHLRIDDRGFTTVELNCDQAKDLADALWKLAQSVE